MKTAAALVLLALAGCAFADEPKPPLQPMTRPEIESCYTLGAGTAAAREAAQARGVVHLSADDVLALKKAGAPEPDIADFIRWERAPERWDPEAAHAAMHDPFARGASKICPVCGGWCKAP